MNTHEPKRTRLPSRFGVFVTALLCSCSSGDGTVVADSEVADMGDGESPSDGGPDAAETDPVPCAPAFPYAPHAILDLPASDGGGPLNLADPVVIRVGDTWYLYATEPSPGHRAWASTDLQHWEDRGYAWSPTPGTWNDRGAHGRRMWLPATTGTTCTTRPTR